MKKSEVRNIIYETLKPVLAPSDFRLKKSQEGFVRQIGGGTQTLGVPLWDYNPRFEFSLTMTIRFDAVQEITNHFTGSPPKYHSMTTTVITQLEHLGLSGHWRAETESELKLKLSEVSNIVRDAIIPFFLRYQDLLSVAAAANPESGLTTGKGIKADRVLFSSGGTLLYRAMSAITLARLAHFENFEALVLRYREELLPFHNPLQHQNNCDKFDKLVEYLREH